jgi:hypothetical protein
MLDEGKISQREYDIVKTELLAAPSEEWVAERPSSVPDSTAEDSDTETRPEEARNPLASWLAILRRLPTPYRAGLVGAVLVLVVAVFIATRSDAAGTVTAVSSDRTRVAAEAPGESLGIALVELTEGWNQVEDPPHISGGITTSPEPGPLDSFLHRFNESALLAGAYDPANGYVHALMVSSSLHYEAVPNLFVHLCYLLHPGSSACLETFVEEAGLFGRTAADLIGTVRTASWEFEGQDWEFEIAEDVETIRVQGADTGP